MSPWNNIQEQQNELGSPQSQFFDIKTNIWRKSLTLSTENFLLDIENWQWGNADGC